MKAPQRQSLGKDIWHDDQRVSEEADQQARRTRKDLAEMDERVTTLEAQMVDALERIAALEAGP